MLLDIITNTTTTDCSQPLLLISGSSKPSSVSLPLSNKLVIITLTVCQHKPQLLHYACVYWIILLLCQTEDWRPVTLRPNVKYEKSSVSNLQQFSSQVINTRAQAGDVRVKQNICGPICLHPSNFRHCSFKCVLLNDCRERGHTLQWRPKCSSISYRHPDALCSTAADNSSTE